MNTTFLYIMQTDFYFKVGITSTSLNNRLKQVQTGCPTPIRNIHYYSYDTRSKAMNAEKILHNSFKRHNTYGEWFTEFSSYIHISQEILGVKFEKIELDINKDMTNYNARYMKKIKKATTIIELDNLYNTVINTDDEYFIDGQKKNILSKIKQKTLEISTAEEKKIFLNSIRDPQPENKSIEQSKIRYSEIVELSKKLKKIRKSIV